MKYCFPILENNGLNSEISPHFGSAPAFMIVDDQSRAFETIDNANLHHAHGMCQPLAALGGHEIDAIIVGGIGMGALNRLQAAGVQVYQAQEGTVATTLEAIQSGRLTKIDAQSACRGHGCH